VPLPPTGAGGILAQHRRVVGGDTVQQQEGRKTNGQGVCHEFTAGLARTLEDHVFTHEWGET